MKSSYLAPLALIVAVGCTPDNATITDGSYTAFLSYTTSRSLQKTQSDWPEKFPGHLLVDCRDIDEEAGEELVPGADTNEAQTACRDFGRDHELWLEYDAYHIVSGPIEEWRGEAILTSEGDVQVTFHTRLPDNQDFRFAFVVDPQFQPRECRQNDSGEPELSDVDGDWVGNWSNDVDEGTMFYLNAGSYQFNPNNTEDVWVFPDEWAAGFAVAKFAEEDVYARSVRYGLPDAYSGYELDQSALTQRDLFYEEVEPGADPTTDEGFLSLVDDVARGDADGADCFDDAATGVSREVECEFNTFTQQLGDAPHVELDTRVHTNTWRIPNESAAGLDGWVELHYNWVRFDQDREDLTIGNAASGEFNLVLDAVESQSRVLVKGSFEIDEIKKDHATVQDLSADKLEEYGTEYCGEPAQGN
jgi:hypothetical protein